MLLAMFIGIYTSRVFLDALGAEDYGLYNLVGGFVGFFTLISSTLTASLGRFITFEIGRGDMVKVNRVFSTAVLVMLGLSVVVIILGETVGLWFIYNKLVIPPERLHAAFWVYQFSMVSFVIGLLMAPYGACIVAHEKMGTFAMISIIDLILKLIICYLIMYNPFDRLIFYSILFFLSSLITTSINYIVCRMWFKECRFHFVFDKRLLKDIFSYATWNFFGSFAWILRGQGAAVILNLFGGPIVNTANAFAGAVVNMTANFQSSFNNSFRPQITKQYAAGEYSGMCTLTLYSAKFSFILLYLFALPVMLNAPFLMQLWLGNVPAHTIEFVRLILIMSLVESFSTSLITAKNATGKIRNYNLIVGFLLLLSLPISYVGMALGAPVEWLYIAYILVCILCTIVRLYMLRNDIPGWSSSKFALMIVRTSLVAMLASLIPLGIYNSMAGGWLTLFITTALSILSNIIFFYTLGLDRNERIFAKSKVKQVINKFRIKWKPVKMSEA